MAKEEIALSIGVDASQATQSVGSFKAQLREATAELVNMAAQFGEGSVQAQNAAKKVASLKDRIGDAKALADTFNPDKKFVALGGALQGAVGGFSALQGAMGLFGSQSKEVQQILLKVQSAMALQQGISGVFGAIDSFKQLAAGVMQFSVVAKIARAAQWAWNAAMAANPIGALVAAIAAVIVGIVSLVSWFSKSAAAAKQQAAAVKEANQALETHKTLLDETIRAMEADAQFAIESAKAQGKSTAEIRKLILAEQDKKIAVLESARVTEEATLKQNEYTLAVYQSADADDEVIKNQEENVKKSRDQINTTRDAIKKGYQDRLALVRKFQNEDDAAATEARKKANEKAQEQRKKAIEDAKEQAKALLEANKEQNKKQEELQQDIFLKNIADDDERAREKLRIDFENSKKEIEQSKASEKEKNETLKLLTEQYYTDSFELFKEQQEKIKQKEEEDKKKEAANKAEKLKAEMDAFDQLNQMRIDAIKNQYVKEQELEALKYQKQLDQINEFFNNGLIAEEQRNAAIETARAVHEANLIKINKDKAAEDEKIDKERYEKKRNQLKQVADTVGQLGEAIGKDTAAGKALAISQALINTYLGASEAIKEKSILPQPFSTIQKIASVAAILATGYKTVKSIAGVKVPGGGGGGSVPSAPSIAQAAPIQPQAQTTRIDQGQINQIGNAAVRAYVVETEVNSQQERRTRIERAARIG